MDEALAEVKIAVTKLYRLPDPQALRGEELEERHEAVRELVEQTFQLLFRQRLRLTLAVYLLRGSLLDTWPHKEAQAQRRVRRDQALLHGRSEQGPHRRDSESHGVITDAREAIFAAYSFTCRGSMAASLIFPKKGDGVLLQTPAVVVASVAQWQAFVPVSNRCLVPNEHHQHVGEKFK